MDAGRDPLDPDSDADGIEDLVEHEYACADCAARPPSGVTCACAVSPACGVPSSEIVLELPYGGPTQERDVYFTVAAGATTSPVNVTASDDACDPDGVDASRFVQGIDPASSVAAAPGAHLRVRVALRNDLVRAGDRRRVYVAFVDAAAAGTGAPFARRSVFVIVPAAAR